MKFSVIFSVDCVREDSIVAYYPPKYRRKWVVTESGATEYSDLSELWEGGKHRKLCAILTEREFAEFMLKCELVTTDDQMLGAIGMPGYGFGIVDSIPLSDRHSSYPDAIMSGCVTPLPETSFEEWVLYQEKGWEKTMELIRETFKKGGFTYEKNEGVFDSIIGEIIKAREEVEEG